MERRYELLAKAGVRDLGTYNRKIAKALEAGPGATQIPESRRIKVLVAGNDGVEHEIEVDAEEAEAVAAASLPEKSQPHLDISGPVEPAPRKLPYIVVVIDEFADLMMVGFERGRGGGHAHRPEGAGRRHSPAARHAASICGCDHGRHQGQLPEPHRIPGAIQDDSKVILDANGAESLLGQGDMLFTDRGQALRRIHGALVNEEEIKRIVDHLKSQGKPVYDLEILKPRPEEGPEGESEPDDDDPTYEQALGLLGEMKQISVSMIQRRLRIGYNRAARVVERMERDGYVGGADGAKPREVLRAPAF